jgi:hypothetical protein
MSKGEFKPMLSPPAATVKRFFIEQFADTNLIPSEANHLERVSEARPRGEPHSKALMMKRAIGYARASDTNSCSAV